MRSEQDRKAEQARRNPHRLRDAINAAHKERNAPPPPSGAKRVMGGYKVRSYLVPQGELNPATWDLGEIKRRMAKFRKQTGVPELDRSKFGTHVRKDKGGWRVVPPVAVLRKLRLEGKAVYNVETRSCTFLDKDEADTVYEKFMAPLTSDDERKAMLHQPEEAFICVYCDHAPWKTIHARVMHETYYCKSRPGAPESSSSEEEESEDESEDDEPEEVVAPPPKRVRFCEWWPWGS